VARDPAGTRKNFDYYYNPFYVGDNNCWNHFACDADGFDGSETGGGGGGGDWNGDGLDDWHEFTEYSWGALRFNGTKSQWRRVWYDGILSQPNAGLRDALLQRAFWGDIRVMHWGDWFGVQVRAVTRDVFLVREDDQSWPTEIGTPGRTRIWLNEASDVFGYSRHQFGFTMAHEMWHYIKAIRGIPEPEGETARETPAHCFAYLMYGWNSPNPRARCP
jgi:hypothetical protein